MLDAVLYTDGDIEQISKAANPRALLPAHPDAREVAREIADSLADSYSEDDWRFVLNTLSPDRAAIDISTRPIGDRHRLLSLVDPPPQG